MNDLLGEIKRVRDECRAACSDLLPSADPLGDARMAYGVVADRLTEIITMSEQRNDTCGLCGELGADKLPHPVYWPDEQRPDTKLVHAECEDAECKRASDLITGKQREDFMRNL